MQKADWFELIDSPVDFLQFNAGLVRSLDVKPGDVTAVKFRIKAKKIGFHPLEVKAFGSKMSDAVKRSLEIVPDGSKVEQVVSDRLTGEQRRG